MPHKSGQLSQQDILYELEQKGDNILKIISISDNKQELVTKHIKYSSFDITPSIVALSSKTGLLENVYQYKNMIANSYYICVKPKDTVLIVSNEYICVPNYISGYVTSRVSNVVKGFGHISTTVDPTWQGALLIALSNPSNQVLKIDVGMPTKEDSKGKIINIDMSQTLATITFHYLSAPYNNNPMEYKSMRADLLQQMQYRNKKGIKAFFRKFYLRRRCKFTDYFFEYLSVNEKMIATQKGWRDFLYEFSMISSKKSDKQNVNIRKKHAYDFVIKENIFNRLWFFCINHKTPLKNIIMVLSIIMLFILLKFDVIDKETFQYMKDVFV